LSVALAVNTVDLGLLKKKLIEINSGLIRYKKTPAQNFLAGVLLRGCLEGVGAG
jgi:hypothetical protein